MTKDDLRAKLQTILSNFTYGVALRCCFPEKLWPQVAGQKLEFQTQDNDCARIELAPLVGRISNPEEYAHLIDEYEKSLRRTLLRETHEVITDYCDATGQTPKYRDEPWYQFARIMRNVVSHKDGGILTKWPPDLQGKSITTVKWRLRTLQFSMIGKPVEFAPYEALLLFGDQKNFVELKLS